MPLKKRKRNWGKNLIEELIPGVKVRDKDGRKEDFGWVI